MLRLMFRKPVRKPSSQSRWLPHRLSKCQSQTTVLQRTPITQMILFNQGTLLLGSNHFLSFENHFSNMRSFFQPVTIAMTIKALVGTRLQRLAIRSKCICLLIYKNNTAGLLTGVRLPSGAVM